MIVDLDKFLATERPYWRELESLLNQLELEPHRRLPLDALLRFQYLYERAAADLSKLTTFSAEAETRRYLEHLVARAYGELHESRQPPRRLRLGAWFFGTLPRTFRRHLAAFALAVGVSFAGALLGGLAMALDPEAKALLLPARFAEHLGDPSERVAREQSGAPAVSVGSLATFSAILMVNNIRVAINALAFGISFGIGTLLVLFYNGVILGVVSVDYVAAGHLKFLLAWLMPHGVIELPAVFMAGQAGLVLAQALIGRGQRSTLAARLRAVGPDLATLIAGVALLLVWAGLVEAFLSQFHAPVLPYEFKIAFGTAELVVLTLFLSRAGRTMPVPAQPRQPT
jgi:uncharacterized membrane protein SpoIIM required for sporulation